MAAQTRVEGSQACCYSVVPSSQPRRIIQALTIFLIQSPPSFGELRTEPVEYTRLGVAPCPATTVLQLVKLPYTVRGRFVQSSAVRSLVDIQGVVGPLDLSFAQEVGIDLPLDRALLGLELHPLGGDIFKA